MHVVGLGVSCSLDHASEGSLSFALQEFACLDDSSRVAFRSDRGFGISYRRQGRQGRQGQLTESELRHHVAMALLPDEGIAEDAGERLPWHEYCELLARIGITASVEILKGGPYVLLFSPEVRRLFDDEELRGRLSGQDDTIWKATTSIPVMSGEQTPALASPGF